MKRDIQKLNACLCDLGDNHPVKFWALAILLGLALFMPLARFLDWLSD